MLLSPNSNLVSYEKFDTIPVDFSFWQSYFLNYNTGPFLFATVHATRSQHFSSGGSGSRSQ